MLGLGALCVLLDGAELTAGAADSRDRAPPTPTHAWGPGSAFCALLQGTSTRSWDRKGELCLAC